MASRTFSEYWHRVAELQVGLLPSVRVHKQQFRGRSWYVLMDAYSHRFYRVTPRAYQFVSRLDPRQRLDDIWQAALERDPDEAPGQEDVIQLLAQLHASNLLYFRGQADARGIFERYRKFKQRELAGKLMGFLFVRVPLWDPSAWLERVRPLVRAAISPAMAMIWLVVVALGALLAVQQSDRLFDQGQGVLSLSNLIWLYLALAGMKVLHEIGHAFVCKRFGGEVHTMGLMFLVFMPLPYMDATASWAFRHRWQRMLVAGMGILVELFLAALGAIVWSQTGPGVINSLAFNVMVIGSVSSLLFNGNPLLRFDGYYVLSDALDIPNLYQKSRQQILYYGERYLFGNDRAHSVATDGRELAWLLGYGITSFAYRLFITYLILLFVFDLSLLLGLLLVVVTAQMWLFSPAYKLISHLNSPGLMRHRRRAWGITLATVLGLSLVIGLVPLPTHLHAPGVLQAQQARALYAAAEGELAALRVSDGEWVETHQVLVELHNPQLALDITITRAQLDEVALILRQSIGAGRAADVAPLEERREALRGRLAELLARQQRQTVRAPVAGRWVGRDLHTYLDGGWVTRGQPLGDIVDGRSFRFHAVVAQARAEPLFNHELAQAEVRLRGQADQPLRGDGFALIPYQRDELVSPALGLSGGGEIMVRPDERGIPRAVEPFYELRVGVQPQPTAAPVLMHGASGELRLQLPGETLFQQAQQRLMQLIQRRYQS